MVYFFRDIPFGKRDFSLANGDQLEIASGRAWGMCPLLLSAIEPHLVQNNEGFMHSTVVSEFLCVPDLLCL